MYVCTCISSKSLYPRSKSVCEVGSHFLLRPSRTTIRCWLSFLQETHVIPIDRALHTTTQPHITCRQSRIVHKGIYKPIYKMGTWNSEISCDQRFRRKSYCYRHLQRSTLLDVASSPVLWTCVVRRRWFARRLLRILSTQYSNPSVWSSMKFSQGQVSISELWAVAYVEFM